MEVGQLSLPEIHVRKTQCGRAEASIYNNLYSPTSACGVGVILPEPRAWGCHTVTPPPNERGQDGGNSSISISTQAVELDRCRQHTHNENRSDMPTNYGQTTPQTRIGKTMENLN